MKFSDKEAQNIYKKITSGWDLDASGLILLETALRAFIRMREAERMLDKEGLIIRSTGGLFRKHPASEIVKNERAGFLAAWKALNLDVEPPGPIGRPGE